MFKSFKQKCRHPHLPANLTPLLLNLIIHLARYRSRAHPLRHPPRLTPPPIPHPPSVLAASGDIARALAGEASAKAAAHPATAPAVGYLWMAINCCVSAAYVLAMRKSIKRTNFSDWETMIANNLLSIPVLAVFSLTLEDWSAAGLALNFPAEGRGALVGAMVFSGAAAVGISYCTAWCVRTTSSTTFSMVGALNKLPIAASGILFFNDPATFASVSAIVLGFVSGLVYSAAKSAQAAQAKLMASTDAPRN